MPRHEAAFLMLSKQLERSSPSYLDNLTRELKFLRSLDCYLLISELRNSPLHRWRALMSKQGFVGDYWLWVAWMFAVWNFEIIYKLFEGFLKIFKRFADVKELFVDSFSWNLWNLKIFENHNNWKALIIDGSKAFCHHPTLYIPRIMLEIPIKKLSRKWFFVVKKLDSWKSLF